MLVLRVLDTSQIQKSWNLELWAVKGIKSEFYCTNLEQINSRKLLKVLFKHIFTINDSKMAIIIPNILPMTFPMIFPMRPRWSRHLFRYKSDTCLPGFPTTECGNSIMSEQAFFLWEKWKTYAMRCYFLCFFMENIFR